VPFLSPPAAPFLSFLKNNKESCPKDDQETHPAVLLRLVCSPQDSPEIIVQTILWCHQVVAKTREERDVQLQVLLDERDANGVKDKATNILSQKHLNAVTFISASSAVGRLMKARRACSEKEARNIVITMPVGSR
jgi:hypothetical protein